ncbi:MAG: DUF72 domain-containing protein [Desulfurococcales archaeon]|nr:DUF72 domain-containing protein [Desulfurococcales archaeon]
MQEVIVGTCGFQKARKRHFEELDAVEVQQTFYDPPPPEKLSSWRREAPQGFIFTVKVWMLVTHGYNKRLWRRLKRKLPFEPESFKPFETSRPVLWALEVTLEAARALETRILVFQTPPSFKATQENARRVTEFFRNAGLDDWEVYWEPRGDWWSSGRKLLEEVAGSLGLRVAGDLLRGREPPGWQDVAYIRLHGLGGRGEVNYRYKYTDSDLRMLLSKVTRFQRAYVMFNNVYAFEDAVRFKKMIREALSKAH